MKSFSPEGHIEKNKGDNQEEKIEKLFGRSLKISNIEDGDSIPVGGNRFGNEMNTMMECDFEKLEGFCKKVEEGVEQLADEARLDKLKQWLEENNTNINPELFAKLTSFNQVYEHEFKQEEDENGEERKGLYLSDNKEAKLSEILHKSSPKCAEIAALAQYFLQEEDIPSTYINGDILRDEEIEFSSDHSYLIIEDDGKKYIYDPSNPLSSDSGPMPSVFSTEANFKEKITKGEKCLVRAENILTDKEVYYGVNDGTNIIPERDLIQ